MRRFSGEEKGYIYSRWGNPTFTEAEDKIAAMETFAITGADGKAIELKAYLQSSGMAAISTMLMSTLRAGDAVLSHYSLYGGTQEIMNTLLPGLNMKGIIEDLRDLNKAEDALKKIRRSG